MRPVPDNVSDLCEHAKVTDRPNLVSTAAAARELGVSTSTLTRWAHAGHVKPAQKTIGGHLRWNLEDLREEVRRITEGE
jgi:predicted site-specific integrase-resolvase